MVKCENCRTREAGLRLDGMVNGHLGTHLYCEPCAEELMRRTPSVQEAGPEPAPSPLVARGPERRGRPRWEYCLIDHGMPGVSPTVVFIEAGSRRVEQISNPLEHMAVLGADGWELVGIEVVVNTSPDPDGRMTTAGPVGSGAYYWFKRPLE